MTPLNKPLSRKTGTELGGNFGPDRGKRLVVTLIPGRPGDGGREPIPDLIEVRPIGTRRGERIAVMDVYQFALRCRVNRDLLTRAREAKARKAERQAADRARRAERKLRREARRDREASPE